MIQIHVKTICVNEFTKVLIEKVCIDEFTRVQIFLDEFKKLLIGNVCKFIKVLIEKV